MRHTTLEQYRKQVSHNYLGLLYYYLQGCEKVGKALNLPPTAVLSGYLILAGYILSPAVVEVPNTDWSEPVLLWLTVCMPTGSGKSTLFRHLIDLLRETRKECGLFDNDPAWLVDDASFEKMGSLMHENRGRLLGLYDELAAFLSQVRLYRGGGLSESHELALFLQLFNGHHWRRDTGMATCVALQRLGKL